MEVESEERSVHTRNAKLVGTELFLCARGSNCSNQKTLRCLHSCVVLTDSSAGCSALTRRTRWKSTAKGKS
jgi:hypothetical protein